MIRCSVHTYINVSHAVLLHFFCVPDQLSLSLTSVPSNTFTLTCFIPSLYVSPAALQTNPLQTNPLHEFSKPVLGGGGELGGGHGSVASY